MSHKLLIHTFLVLLASLFMATVAWAVEAEEDTDSQVQPDPQQPDTKLSDAENAAKVAERAEAAHLPPDASAQAAALAQDSTDPTAILTQFSNLFWTTASSDDNNISNTYLFQPVLPLSKKNVLRPALPVINTSDKTSIGDLFLLDVFISPVKTGSWGWGVAGSVPIGDDKFSTNKWQAGPALLYINKTSDKALWGILGYNQWSFAGKSSAKDVNILTFQPIVVVHTDWGYWGWTDQDATVDWKNDNQTTIPLGLKFGTVFKAKTPLNASVGFYYSLRNKGLDNVFGVKFTATFIMPNMLRH